MTETVFGFGGVSGAKEFVDKHGFEALYTKAQKITSDKLATISEELGKVKEQREGLASRLEEVLEELEAVKSWKEKYEPVITVYNTNPDKLVQHISTLVKEKNLIVHPSLLTGKYVKKEGGSSFTDYAAATREFETSIKRRGKSPSKSPMKTFPEVKIKQ